MTNEEREIIKQAEQIKKNESSRNKAQKAKKRKGFFTKTLITLIFLYLFYFTERVFVVFEKTSVEPTTLIVSVFAILGLECGVMGWIKNTKIKKGE